MYDVDGFTREGTGTWGFSERKSEALYPLSWVPLIERIEEYMAETIDHVIEPNPVTGELRAVPVGQAGEHAAAAGVETTGVGSAGASRVSYAPAEMALFEDDESSAPSTQIKVRGRTFYIRELDREQMRKLKCRNQEIADSLGLSVGIFDNPDRLNEALQGVPDGHERYADEQIRTYENVIEQCVKGWDCPRPYSRDQAMKLVPSAKREIFSEIIAKSRLGASSSDFLAE